ncbi:MAG: RNA polymerase subunit sigma [Taibaiella sp.]|nr:RNA polymerase subunit sigma [Taibaiella sp.]
MVEVESIDNNLLPHLFRTEYTKMIAVICHLFGMQHIELAEDIASDTFLKATEIWSLKGIPENPIAWLYTVAKNKTKDYLKRNVFFEKEILPNIKAENLEYYETNIDFTEQNIKDSQLAMIFAVCDPANSQEAQICLALQILCGFSLEDIANAFLSNKETIKKRLQRARENLRRQHFEIQNLDPTEILLRLDAVITTLYLLFNEGYFSRSNDKLIRKDLCSEAMRLTFTLTENAMTNTGKVNALLALQCFQSSRLDARVSASEETVLFDEQDKNLWNTELINKGNYYLVEACSKDELSKYHLEASIAYWHTTADDNEKWKYILPLYNQLILVEYSPITALNRTFAFSKVYGNEKAIAEAEKLNLQINHYYHSLLGYLYSPIDTDKAIRHFRQSISLTNSDVEKKQLSKTIYRLEKDTQSL